jgi:hypothetical protein
MTEKVKSNAIINLRKFTPEGARMGQRKGLEVRLENIELREKFRKNALAFQKVMHELPEMLGLDVMKLCIHMALADEDYAEAARLGKELAEYERPKLQRIENLNKDQSRDMSDEELIAALRSEGLLPSGLNLSKVLGAAPTSKIPTRARNKKKGPPKILSTAPLKAPPGFTRKMPKED